MTKIAVFASGSGTNVENIIKHFKFNNNKSNFSDIPIKNFINFISSNEYGSYIKLEIDQKNEKKVKMNWIKKK